MTFGIILFFGVVLALATWALCAASKSPCDDCPMQIECSKTGIQFCKIKQK